MSIKRKKPENEDYSYPEQRILPVHMEAEVRKSFIEYAMSVIVSRALPDVRDGLKPVHRRVLFTMYEDHLTYDKAFYKSATTVGAVLGRYHPHGDSAVYDTLVRLAQDFSMRYPLIEGEGNFGNIDGDGAAAYRYTDARMAKIAGEMLSDIDKDVVNMVPNFDNRRKEPEVLPARFPNLLVNGSVGIAVGMATNIPPHNLREAIDGTVYLMEHPEADVADLMKFIKGPDFPTGAVICGSNGILSAYKTGKGLITVRAKAEVMDEKEMIVITEIPYMVRKSDLVRSMADCVNDKKIDGIRDIIDASSDENGISIEVHLKNGANGEVVLNQLYKYTELQHSCSVNMLAIVNGEPKVLNLKQVLEYYIEHQEQVVTRRTQFELNKALAEMHIYEGYHKALDHIDEIIAMIKASESVADAKQNLIDSFGFSDVQAQAIVEMTLGRLSGLERKKIEDRLAVLRATVSELQAILADENRIKEIIKDEMLAIRDKYGDDRRTELAPMADEIVLEDLIERHTAVVTLSREGYIKRMRSDVYTAQHRGGKGIIGMTTKESDFVIRMAAVDSHSTLMLFTSRGKVQMLRAFQIPEAGRTAKGTNLVNLLELEEGEKVTAMISIDGSFEPEEDGEERYLLFVTMQGVVKRTPLSEYAYQRKGGKRALTLDEGDELLFVRLTKGDGEILLATHEGMAVRFREDDVRVMGRSARGVRGIRLREGDFCVGAVVIEEGKDLLTVTECGFGKRCAFEEFNTKNRGGIGVCCHRISEKTGPLCGIAAVSDDEDIMLITGDGTVIRTPAAGIPLYSRTAGGVIIMRLAGDAKIYSFSLIEAKKDDGNAPEDGGGTDGEDVSDTGSGDEASTDAYGAPDGETP